MICQQWHSSPCAWPVRGEKFLKMLLLFYILRRTLIGKGLQAILLPSLLRYYSTLIIPEYKLGTKQHPLPRSLHLGTRHEQTLSQMSPSRTTRKPTLLRKMSPSLPQGLATTPPKRQGPLPETLPDAENPTAPERSHEPNNFGTGKPAMNTSFNYPRLDIEPPRPPPKPVEYRPTTPIPIDQAVQRLLDIIENSKGD